MTPKVHHSDPQSRCLRRRSAPAPAAPRQNWYRGAGRGADTVFPFDDETNLEDGKYEVRPRPSASVGCRRWVCLSQWKIDQVDGVSPNPRFLHLLCVHRHPGAVFSKIRTMSRPPIFETTPNLSPTASALYLAFRSFFSESTILKRCSARTLKHFTE